MKTLGSAQFFTSNAAIAVYIVIFALLIVVISFTTMLDIKKKNEFRRQNNLENAEKMRENKKTRFPELAEIDKSYKEFVKEPTDTGLTLETLCTGFRDYCADQLNLYYTIEDIRKFIANLTVSKTMILQGLSGTGKASLKSLFR